MALPNLRRLFVEARTEAEENEYVTNLQRTAPELSESKGLQVLPECFLQFGAFYLVCGSLQFDCATDEWCQEHEMKLE